MALTVKPDSELALDSLVRLELAANDRPRALDYLRRYTVAVGDDEAGLLLAAGYYLRLEHYDEALELANRAGEKNHPDKVHRILGLVCFRRGDAAEAVRHLGQAEADSEVLDGLLNAYLALGRLGEAVEGLAAADKIAKPSAALRRTCDQLRRLQARRTELDRPAPADRAKEWAVALDRLVCAEWRAAEGRPLSQIKELLSQAFATGLAPGPAFALRGRLALESGKLGKALTDAEQAITRSPAIQRAGTCAAGCGSNAATRKRWRTWRKRRS